MPCPAAIRPVLYNLSRAYDHTGAGELMRALFVLVIILPVSTASTGKEAGRFPAPSATVSFRTGKSCNNR